MRMMLPHAARAGAEHGRWDLTPVCYKNRHDLGHQSMIVMLRSGNNTCSEDEVLYGTTLGERGEPNPGNATTSHPEASAQKLAHQAL